MSLTPVELIGMGTAVVVGVGLMVGGQIKKIWNSGESTPNNPYVPTPKKKDGSSTPAVESVEDSLTFSLSKDEKSLVSYYLKAVKEAAPNADHRIWFDHAMEGRSIPQILSSEAKLAADADERKPVKEPTETTS